MSAFGLGERRGKWSVWRFNWLVHHKIIRALERARPFMGGVLLDVGCGTKPFARVIERKLEHYWGADLPDSRFIGGGEKSRTAGGRGHATDGAPAHGAANASGRRAAARGETTWRRPDVFARGEALPFRDGSFDTVLGLSMLTYMPEPGRFIDEAHRVLRPGGVLVLEFTQMAPLHDEPQDYFRFTRYGAAWLLERAGFEPVEFIPIGGLWARVGLSTIAALNRVNRGPTRILTELPVRALYIALQLLFEALDRLFFDPRETLAHLVVAKRR